MIRQGAHWVSSLSPSLPFILTTGALCLRVIRNQPLGLQLALEFSTEFPLIQTQGHSKVSPTNAHPPCMYSTYLTAAKYCVDRPILEIYKSLTDK
jgi:hypothetical protein